MNIGPGEIMEFVNAHKWWLVVSIPLVLAIIVLKIRG